MGGDGKMSAQVGVGPTGIVLKETTGQEGAFRGQLKMKCKEI